MKKLSIRLTALALVFITLMSMLPVSIFANETTATVDDTMKLSVSSTTGIPGNEVIVTISLANNPGISGLIFDVKYDEVLTLEKVEFSDKFEQATASEPYSNPQRIGLQSPFKEVCENGTFATLTFKISEDVADKYAAMISVTYEPYNVVDSTLTPVDMAVIDGVVMIYEGIPGDLNGDMSCNLKDAVLLFRHLSGWNDTVDSAALDVNGDNKVSIADSIALYRYVAGWPGIEIFRGEICTHDLVHIDRVEATCPDSGNIEYWHCTLCDRYYTNEAGTEQIYKEDTVLEAIGHNKVIVKGKDPTTKESGYTESIECSICGAILVAPQVIEPLKENQVYVKFNIAGSDTYLQKVVAEKTIEGVKLHNNELIFNTSNVGHTFDNISSDAIPGYDFKGWHDIYGNPVSGVEKNQNGVVEVYAKWEKETYHVYFHDDKVNMKYNNNGQELKNEIIRTVDKGIESLAITEEETKKIDKYIFTGWSDKNGKIWDEIPAGYAGDLDLYGNWVSTRNLAQAVAELKAPIIVEDSKDGIILFTYEIGTIENVPLYTTLKLHCANGLITTVEQTNQTTIGSEDAKKVASIISNATTNSTSWTMENSWNSTTSVNQSVCEENGWSQEQAQSYAQTQSGSYNVGTSYGDSSTYFSKDGYSYKYSADESFDYINNKGSNFGLNVDTGYSAGGSLGAGISLPIPETILEFGIEAGVSSNWDIGLGLEYNNYKNETGTYHSGSNMDLSYENSQTYTNEKYWNTTESFTQSNSKTVTEMLSNTVSKLVSEQYDYAKEYSEGGKYGNNQESSSTDTKSDEYSSTFKYYTSEITTTKNSYSGNGDTHGDYRMVMAGTVHVFAVVGYDVKTSSYFVTTYSVLDDETKEYLDYSYDGTFSDCETSIIPFEIPSFVNDYVNNRIAKTEGLRIDTAKGIVDKYTPNADNPATIISVPSYIAVDNGDGSFKSVKVTGIASDLFRNNKDIVAVILGAHITEIPDYAFEGCTSLKYVICPSVTKIGDYAFNGCTSLEEFKVSDSVVSVGKEAFEGVPSITSVAANTNVATAIASSNAQKIVLDISQIAESDNMSLSVGNISYFELRGKDKVYSNLNIKSDANTTVLNGLKIEKSVKIPLELGSETVILNRVEILEISTSAILLKSLNTNIILEQTNKISTSGNASIICQNISISQASLSVKGELEIPFGDILVCGEINGSDNITFGKDNKIVYIDYAEYKKYIDGVFVINFDAKEGVLSETSKIVYYGEPIGELPTPTKNYHNFLGWFTQNDEPITEDRNFEYNSNITVYAKWELKPIKGWINISDLPAGAQIVDNKWTYTKREYTTSSSSSLSGWVHYNTAHTGWTDWSAWATWNPDNGARDVQYQSVYDHTEYHYYRWTNSNHSALYTYKTSSYNCTILEEAWFNYELPASPEKKDPIRYNGTDNWANRWVRANYAGNYSVDKTFTRDIYRDEWRYRDPVYTYYFYQDVHNKETTSDPTGLPDVSNVVHLVQYREK